MSINQEKVDEILSRVLSKEKEFINEKYIAEAVKVKEIKRIIEEEIKVNDN